MPQAIPKTHKYHEKKIFLWRSNQAYFIEISFLLGVLFSVFISIWMVINWMKDVQSLPPSKLIVTGKRHYTSNDAIRRSILALSQTGTFMTQNVNIIQSQIKRMPWIKQVRVKKEWPDTLKIHLVEYVPIAHWNDQCMVDVDGNFFSVPNKYRNRQDLPRLYGPENNDNEALQGFCNMAKVLTKSRFVLKNAIMTVRRSWQLTLANGIKLNLGRDNTMKRLAYFLELYPILQQQAQTNGKRISYIDLRYNSGAAVGWEQVIAKKSAQ